MTATLNMHSKRKTDKSKNIHLHRIKFILDSICMLCMGVYVCAFSGYVGVCMCKCTHTQDR